MIIQNYTITVGGNILSAQRERELTFIFEADIAAYDNPVFTTTAPGNGLIRRYAAAVKGVAFGIASSHVVFNDDVVGFITVYSPSSKIVRITVFDCSEIGAFNKNAVFLASANTRT